MLKISDIFKPSKANWKENNMWVDFLRRNEYPEAAVYSAALKLDKLPSDLQEILLHWDKTGEMPETEAEDFTVQELVEYKGLHEIAAVLMIDWLRRKPEEAKLALAEPITKFSIGEEEIRGLEQSDEADADGKRCSPYESRENDKEFER